MSPDGNWVGFVSNFKLQKVPVQGGASINICDLPGSLRGATWTEDDTIIFGSGNLTGLWQVSADGGQPVQITKSGTGGSHLFPEALPGNKAVLFTMWPGSNDGASIGVLDRATGTTRVLVQSGTYPKFVKSGHILYVERGALRAVTFDVDRVAVLSDPVTLLDGVSTKPTGASNFAVADDGTLAYVAGGFSGDNSLVWVDRQGRQEPLKGLSQQNYQIVRVSPKGTHLVTDFGQPRDVWSYDITRGTAVRVTTDASDDQFPIWSPDGERIVFTSNRSGRPEIYSQLADGSGAAEKLFERPESQGRFQAEAWSKDGHTLLLTDALGGSTTSSIQLDGDRRYAPPLVSKFIEGGAAVSPDGHWIAYQNNRSGAMAVYVERYPEHGSLQKVSPSGGFAARWAPDGNELYYLMLDGRSLMAVPVSTGETLKIGTERKLFDGSFRTSGPGIRPYDVMPDGKRFVMIRQDSIGSESPRLIVVQHWSEELKRRVPARSR
jgi:Tol biopolymer transport system component